MTAQQISAQRVDREQETGIPMNVALASLLMTSLLVGCTSSGSVPFGQGAGAPAGLSKSNFRIVKSNVRGDSYGFKFLGFIPIVPARVADAKSDLYHKLSSSGERLEGRSIALTNATEDQTSYYFIIGSVPRITLSADIIEFLDDRPSAERSVERTSERPSDRVRSEEQVSSGSLAPSTILRPSTLNSQTQQPQPAAALTPPAASPAPISPSGLAPIRVDEPIAEYEIPPSFSSQGREPGGTTTNKK